MKNTIAPKFISTPYFYIDDDGWHLTPDAPEEVVREFEEFMKEYEDKIEQGVAI